MKILFCLIFLTTYVNAFYKVDPKTKFIKDDQGRSVIFHGVNAVYKIPPYYPELDNFDPLNSLSEIDLQNLHSWGFNVIRLGVMWPGVMPYPKTSNETYLKVVKDLISSAAKYNISILIDAHQDVLSPKFCGEGAPDYAINIGVNKSYTFPFPVQASIDRDPVTGYPLLKECLKRPFNNWYFTLDASRAFQSLYADPVTQQHFIDFWTTVAKYFRNDENVLGYELINEPWMGDIYEHIGDIIPGYTELELLQPLYDKLFDAISIYDPDHLIFFEAVPAVSEVTPSGFTHGPGGLNQTARQVWSYHMYCPFVNKSGTPEFPVLCKDWDSVSHFVANSDANRLGNAAMLTEFGALDDNPYSLIELDTVTGLADKTMNSWAYWTYKPYHDVTTANQDGSEGFYYANGTLQQNKVSRLSRSYAQAISGNPIAMSFDPETKAFYLKYDANPAIKAPTIIYFNQDWSYPNGVNFTIVPKLGHSVQIVHNYVYVVCESCTEGSVEITITHKS